MTIHIIALPYFHIAWPVKGEFQAKTHAPLIDPFCHIATYLVDIIFAKVVCISIPGGLPELPRPQLIMGVNCPYLLSLSSGSSGAPPSMHIQTTLAKKNVYQVGCYMAKVVN